MAGPTPTADDIIEIPSDVLALGHDEDGLPKTVAGDVEEPEPKAREPDPEIKTLKQRLDEAERDRERLRNEHQTERTAREKAEKARDETATLAVRAREDAVTSQYREALQAQREIETGLQSHMREKAILEAQKESIWADDNYDPKGRAKAVGAIDSQISEIVRNLAQFDMGKSGVEARVAEAKRTYEDTQESLARLRERPTPKAEEQPEVKAPQPPKNADEFISGAPAQLKGWLGEHREFADPQSDENVDLQGFAAKWLRKNGGNQATLNSEAFREALDAKFFPEAKESDVTEERETEPVREAKPAPKTRTTKPAAAPVMRDSELYSSRNPNAKAGKLPPKLAEKVRAMGLDATKYFHESVELIKKGELPKNYLDHDYDHNY